MKKETCPKVVLVEPEIPFNTGNVARTCVATNTPLHLVKPLGFSLEDRYMKRAGLDYWPHLDLTVHENLDQCEKAVFSDQAIYLFEPQFNQEFWDVSFEKNSVLVFGKETLGLPKQLIERYPTRCVRIPMPGKVRSLNLSSTVAVVLFEVLRQHR